MRVFKFLMFAGVILAVTGSANALTSNASMLAAPNQNLRFSVNFAGFEINYGTPDGISLGTGAAVGYVPSALDPMVNGGGMYVLYNSAGTVVADIHGNGLSSPGVANLAVLLAGNSFTAFGVGTIDSIQNPDGSVVAIPQTRPGGPGTTYQMTFTVNGLAMKFTPVANPLNPGSFDTGIGAGGLGTGTLLTTFQPGGALHFLEDSTTDAYGAPNSAGIPATPGVVAGELPTAYMSGSTYYEPVANRPAFSYETPAVGAEFDPAQSAVLTMTHIGGLTGTDSFYADLRGPAVVGSAGLPVNHPTYGALTLWSGGRTTFQDSATSLAITGGTWAGPVLDPNVGFRMTSDVAFGYYQTGNTPLFGGPLGWDPGALPEDPLTFTFQTPEGGGPEIFGGQVVPEPMTMLAVFLGVGSLSGYVRRRIA